MVVNAKKLAIKSKAKSFPFWRLWM